MNIIVHCSDGWDRTAQQSALIKLMLDPYYRTIKGFLYLIEVDWLQFGHMTQRRFGNFRSDYKDGDRSQVFHQWLDIIR